MVQERDDIVGLDAGILMHPQVWVTSGHVGSFSDPMVECATCQRRYRLDELPGADTLSQTEGQATPASSTGWASGAPMTPVPCPRRDASTSCSRPGWVLSRTRRPSSTLRPETAQGSYVNFKNVQQSMRKKLPFGIAQIGKSFRERDQPRQLRVPDARVRADGDAVLRPPRRGRPDLRGMASPSVGLVPEAGCEPGAAPLPRARIRRAGPLRQEGHRYRISLPIRLEGLPGHPQPRRLRPGQPPAGVG